MKQIGNFRIYVHYTSNTNTMNSLTTISGTRIIDIILIIEIHQSYQKVPKYTYVLLGTCH